MKPLDFYWIFSLVATAFGAGVLYIPANAIFVDTWAIFLVGLLAALAIAIGHTFLSRIVLYQDENAERKNISEVVNDNMGKIWGYIFSLVFFLSTFTVILIYSLGIRDVYTNAFSEIFNLDGSKWSFAYISALLVPLLLMLIGFLDTKKTIKIITIFAITLLVSIVFLSVYLFIHSVPSSARLENGISSTSIYQEFELFFGFFSVMVFGMNFSSIVPRFSLCYRQHVLKSTMLIFIATGLLLFLLLFFSLACKYVIPADVLSQLKSNCDIENVSALQIIQRSLPDKTILNSIGLLISILLLTGSFIGTFIGTREATESIVKIFAPKKDKKQIEKIAFAVIIIMVYFVVLSNISIKQIISEITSPSILALIYVIPVAFFIKTRKQQKPH